MADSAQIQELLVSGMTCGHCRAAVETALKDVPGVTAAKVDLEHGKASVEGNVQLQSLVEAVEEAGYEAISAGGK